VLQGYVANQGDAWQFTLRALTDYYEKARHAGSLAASEISREPILALADRAIPDDARRRIGSYLDSAALLGRRTAELHLALASARQDPAFTPQRFSEAEQQKFVVSAMDQVTANFGLLRHFSLRRLKDEMPDHIRQEADRVLSLEDKARQRFQGLSVRKLSPMLTRIHGDYHLGQVLFTGSDFVIIDFEGEPARSLEERRKKRSPLQDIAGMLRSFHYAAYAPVLQQATGRGLDERAQALGSWAYYWQRWVSVTFLKAYLDASRGSEFIPHSREELSLLLDAYLLDKAVYELGYELNNRPSWVRIPLEGISQLLQDQG
jgi:maltose alpha-D-glucosyltransferase/alpha-amylase